MRNLLQYIFVFLIIIMLYLIYLVGSYKYTEYRILQYTEELVETNQAFLESIRQAKFTLEYKNTKAYKNQILKSQWGRKNKWEEVVYLIQEEKFNKYTQSGSTISPTITENQNLSDEQSLISTMSVYERWIYLIFWRDIR